MDARICSNVNIVMGGKNMIITLTFTRLENVIKKIASLAICVHFIIILKINDKFLKIKNKYKESFQITAK